MPIARTSEAAPLRENKVVPSPEGASLPAKSRVEPAGTGAPFERLLKGLGQALDQGENVTERAIRGTQAGSSPAELIALQAGIYRFSEAVDLASKIVDKGTQAVRTTLQNQ
jgi:hypothetical protein